jgi:hypothetical protein
MSNKVTAPPGSAEPPLYRAGRDIEEGTARS